MTVGGGRPVRLYESALAGVRYVYRAPAPIPFRKQFKSDADHRAALKRHADAKADVEVDEEIRAAAKLSIRGRAQT